MKKLLSVPPNLVDCFHELTGLSKDDYFCTCDPIGHRLGSGGGTVWLLHQAADWLGDERCIILHAGGQSRRLPSYAVSGKILAPIPVFRWERGQRLSQTLLDLQLPLYERMMETAPKRLRTMIVSGDVYIRAAERIGPVPDADVVCYGLWLDASIAKDHGVFVSDRRTPNVLKMMLQKPSTARLSELSKDHFYLTDIGIWLLSDKALELLKKRSENSEHSENSEFPLKEYDLYGEFGCTLGTHPTIDDPELRELSVAVVPLPGGEFYHFGTSREMISSTVAIQNIVNDQREIMHHDRKPHPSIFIQNAITHYQFTPENRNIWIENSYIGPRWQFTYDNVVTGVPKNDWDIRLEPGECIDVVPVGEQDYEIRRYHIDEAVNSNDLAERANLRRLFVQRKAFRKEDWSMMARNWQHSVFYQLDLDDASREFKEMGITMPPVLPETAPLMNRIHDAMLRDDKDRAFALLREGILASGLSGDSGNTGMVPRLSVYRDQIVWGRSPVRIDLAGGWTDTPPFCLMEGGRVVNIAIELNGQPPLQAYVKPCETHHIVLRSIDLGASEVVETYDQLGDFMHVGSPFSIPKAALALAGFLPRFSAETYPSLKAQLENFGSGIELTLLSAIPAGSGLGTSSILAATVLGAVSDFCSLAWDKNEIGRRTLVLEQLLTTGGGWQDQFGGVLGGVKLLETTRGFEQNPVVRWLPNDVFTQPEYQACHLLYYTGVTRTAKKILAEIVRRMFLNQHEQLLMLRSMKAHSQDLYEALQRNDFMETGRLIRKTWQQNQLLDSGTNPDSVRRITHLIDDLCLGYKLPGAGGGGYLYMVAKDPEAAARIKQVIQQSEQNPNARFVDMTLSKKGLQISRS
jgi:galactokinase/mevalonate kinase-like predicted kinase